LVVSLVWGSVGVGYYVYCKRQTAWAPMAGGVLMMLLSSVVGSAWLLSALCVGVIAGVHQMLRKGD
jgi:hypothetical protein